MKKEKKDAAPNPETAAAPKAPAKPRKEKKPKPPKSDGVQLPVLVEFTYTFSIILLIFVGLAMIIISFLNGATLLNLVLRTSVALLVLGGLVLFISSQVSSGVLQASLVEQEQAQTSQQPQADEIHEAANAANVEALEMAEGS